MTQPRHPPSPEEANITERGNVLACAGVSLAGDIAHIRGECIMNRDLIWVLLLYRKQTQITLPELRTQNYERTRREEDHFLLSCADASLLKEN